MYVKLNRDANYFIQEDVRYKIQRRMSIEWDQLGEGAICSHCNAEYIKVIN